MSETYKSGATVRVFDQVAAMIEDTKRVGMVTGIVTGHCYVAVLSGHMSTTDGRKEALTHGGSAQFFKAKEAILCLATVTSRVPIGDLELLYASAPNAFLGLQEDPEFAVCSPEPMEAAAPKHWSGGAIVQH